MIRPPPRSTLFPSRRSSDLESAQGRQGLLRPPQEHHSGCQTGGGESQPIRLSRSQAAQTDLSRLVDSRSEEHTSELQSHVNLVCRLLLEKKNKLKYAMRIAY